MGMRYPKDKVIHKPTDQSNNNVTISGNEPQGAEIYGGYSDSEETKSNTINVDPGTFIGNLYPNSQKKRWKSYRR
ncbi:hypothetical protein CFFBT1098_08755 [Campylobacter fetus subsp. fetus BT 10/98]|nr:hypothetical protein [Campylobacter fetus]EAM0409079.1 hypothetical protein [Campylobacter fetus]OCS17937.1 hypothetical protein CFFBT1098_08755 [Campylobacter fetus subsp. fetus BT 10/98]